MDTQTKNEPATVEQHDRTKLHEAIDTFAATINLPLVARSAWVSHDLTRPAAEIEDVFLNLLRYRAGQVSNALGADYFGNYARAVAFLLAAPDVDEGDRAIVRKAWADLCAYYGANPDAL